MVVGGTCYDGRTRTYSLEEILTEKKIYNTRASAFHTAACFSFFLKNNVTIQYSGEKSAFDFLAGISGGVKMSLSARNV